jgi:acyl-CoA synthetase (AMP-forming)/AMP-acid ligase II
LLASIGRPLSWVDTRIVDEENRDLPGGEIGELVVRSDLVFPGYWRAPDKSREMFFGEWLRTGDLARRDADGYVFLADRAKFRIKTGGYNVFPTEIENVLAEHPAVHEVAVFGVPDKVWGDRIEAVVSLKPGAGSVRRLSRNSAKTRSQASKFPGTSRSGRSFPKARRVRS